MHAIADSNSIISVSTFRCSRAFSSELKRIRSNREKKCLGVTCLWKYIVWEPDMSSPAWEFNMLSFWDKFWTTFLSPLGLRKMLGSCSASQKKHNFAAHLSGGVPGDKSPLRKSILPLNYVREVSSRILTWKSVWMSLSRELLSSR